MTALAGLVRACSKRHHLKDEVPVPVALRGPKGVDHVGGGVPPQEVGLLLHATKVKFSPLQGEGVTRVHWGGGGRG